MTSGWCMMLRAILCRSCKEPSPHQPSARGASYSGGRMYITGQGASVRLSDLHTQSLAVWRWRRYQKPQTRNQCAMCAGATRPSPHKLVPQSQCGGQNNIPDCGTTGAWMRLARGACWRPLHLHTVLCGPCAAGAGGQAVERSVRSLFLRDGARRGVGVVVTWATVEGRSHCAVCRVHACSLQTREQSLNSSSRHWNGLQLKRRNALWLRIWACKV